MAKPSLAAVRASIQTRLRAAYTGTAWHVYAKAQGAELMPAFIVIPVPRPGGWYLAQGGAGSDGSCPIAYTFIVEAWVPFSPGLDKAQDALDEIVSPAGTSALSIEGVLENVSGAYATDALGLLASSVKCDQFLSYGFAALNSDANDALMARIPLEVLV